MRNSETKFSWMRDITTGSFQRRKILRDLKMRKTRGTRKIVPPPMLEEK